MLFYNSQPLTLTLFPQTPHLKNLEILFVSQPLTLTLFPQTSTQKFRNFICLL